MKKDRHAKVEVNCENCGKPFLARKERVDEGLGRFCSKMCFDSEQRRRAQRAWGKREVARRYKVGDRYVARWYDESGRIISEPYPKWWWGVNIGEIPDDMIVLYKDGNALNIDPSNFYLGTRSDALVRANQTRKQDPVGWKKYIEKLRQKQIGFKHTPESKAKISAVHKGKTLSEEQKERIGQRTAEMWQNGFFDNVHKGENNWRWRGGVEKPYPSEFNNQLRDFIKSRDDYQCQICSKDLYRSRNAQVHHRNGNKKDNDPQNLILLCSTCHGLVHSKKSVSPPIMALREELHWS